MTSEAFNRIERGMKEAEAYLNGEEIGAITHYPKETNHERKPHPAKETSPRALVCKKPDI